MISVPADPVGAWIIVAVWCPIGLVIGFVVGTMVGRLMRRK